MACLQLQLKTFFAPRLTSVSHRHACTPSFSTGWSGGFPPKLSSSILFCASEEGLPVELLEDAKFVPIKDDDPQYGPPALLLLGFSYSEVEKVQEFLKTMEGDFLKVLLCTKDMMKGTLWNAMHTSQLELANITTAKDVPRICFLSGLTGEELMMFVRAFPEAGLESNVFAAMVPNNAQKTVNELVEEIMGDHERLKKEEK